MDTSSLARDIDNLEQAWSSIDWWLDFWTILVVIGVAVELLVMVTEYYDDRRDFERGVIHAPEKPRIAVFGLGFIGAALVALGVAGEFGVHIKSGRIETDMRDKTRQLVALAQEESVRANERAADANRKAGEANKEAALLRLKNSQIVAALQQPALSKGDFKSLVHDLRSCPDRDITPLVVESMFTSNLGIHVFNALQSSGFTRVEYRSSPVVWQGTSIHGPNEHFGTIDCIDSALVKKTTIWGAVGTSDTPGSPIIITVGEVPVGALPK